MGGVDYQYDGEGRRVQETVSSVVTKYLLDIQPGLSVVLSETTGANTMRYVHSPRGIHAHKDTGGNWEWMVQDGLGNVRGVVDNSVGVLESRNYDPYGTGFGATGSNQTDYGFTGEPTDTNGLLYLRARYYNPAAGVFTALDPFEGIRSRPMSLNGYSWVEGNVPNAVDPSGQCLSNLPSEVNNCLDILSKALFATDASEKARLLLQYSSCLSSSPYNVINTINNATVFMRTGCNASSSKPSCIVPSLGISTGTLVDFDGFVGVITHDHFNGLIPGGVSSNMAAIESFDWIEFVGHDSTKRIDTDTFAGMSVNRPLFGILTIALDDASSLGTPIKSVADQQYTLAEDNTVYFAYIDPNKLNGGTTSQLAVTKEDMYVGYAKITKYKLYNDSISNTTYYTEVQSGEIAPGDSGSGWFDINGKLIGVTYNPAQIWRVSTPLR